jgi:hypothetical protein
MSKRGKLYKQYKRGLGIITAIIPDLAKLPSEDINWFLKRITESGNTLFGTLIELQKTRPEIIPKEKKGKKNEPE